MAKIAKKINIITLGCSKNLTDSEQFAAQAAAAGFEVVHNSQVSDFEIAFVNTCGFINDAKEESINTILELVDLKANKKLKKIVVFGCLAERYFSELKTEIPEVDVFVGNYDLQKLMDSIESTAIDNNYDRVFDSEGHYAFLKIAEGCNRNCAFCAIPLFKGKFVSRDMSDIIQEAEFLAAKGVKELILIAQDVSYYGYDLNKNLQLPDLVERLNCIEGIEWIRLHYLYPFMFPARLLDVISENSKVCKYIDIPLQHISDKVLKAMNRGGTKQETITLLDKIRQQIPNAVIRTTMLVGHPGEGEEEFQELLDFVKEQRFDRLGVFTYSEEEGTRAAANHEDSIPQEVKEERAQALMDIQREISAELNMARIGKIFKVIVDRKELDYYVGRTEFDSVEVDNEVIITSDEELLIGSFYNVKINSSGDYELFGEKI
jgi:ribosomal protein S12 methylthiotransferase